MSATVLVLHGAAPTDHFLTSTTLAAQNKIFLRVLLWRRELMADLARHRRLCRALRGSPLQRLGLLALSCSLLLEHPAISCSLLHEHPARYLILLPAPTLGGRRRGAALVAEWARGAIVAARAVVEDADRFFTIMREWARSAVSAAALREENTACHALPGNLGWALRSSESHGLLMERRTFRAVTKMYRSRRTSRTAAGQRASGSLASVLHTLAAKTKKRRRRERVSRAISTRKVRQQPNRSKSARL